MIFVGDFFQLPPVTKMGDVMRYAFESTAWESARPLVCYLTDQYRQDDELLLGLLKSIRQNEVEEEHFVKTWVHDDHWDAAANALKK